MKRDRPESTGEEDLIRWLRERRQDLPESVLQGIGDDCAVIDPSFARRLVVTSDMLIEDVHFRLRWSSPGFLARKALAVNLSDLAAMGAGPYGCFLNLAFPPQLTQSFFFSFMEAFLKAAHDWGLFLLGGDLSRSQSVHIGLSLIGCIGEGEPLYRSSARPGDRLALVGRLGFSSAGLRLLEREDPADLCRIDSLEELRNWAGGGRRYELVRSHLLPEPRLPEGKWLRENRLCHAMIDVSDGLALDLHRLAEAGGVRAEIESDRLAALSPAPDDPDWDTILFGGEDYALLLSLSDDQLEQACRIHPPDLAEIHPIGRILEGPAAVELVGPQGRRPVSPRGFDHFAGS